MIIQNIQALRGIAALCLVLHHLSFIEQKYSQHQIIPSSIVELGIFGVDLFFAISGFIMVSVTRGQFQHFSNAKNFLVRRVIRIYPIYWVFTAFALLAFLINPLWVNSSQNNQFELINSLLLIPSDMLPLLSVGWTLIHEMYFYLVFALFIWLASERYLSFMLIVWAVVLVICNMNDVDAYNAFTRLAFNPMTLEFIGGALLAIIISKPNTENTSKHLSSNFNQKTALYLGLGLLIVYLITLYYARGYTFHFNFTNPKLQANAGEWRRIINFGLPAIIAVLLVVYLEHKNHIFNRFCLLLGDCSYSLYLSHVLVISACGKIWKTLSLGSIYENYVVVPVILLLTFIVAWLSYRFIEKPLIKMSKKHLPSPKIKQPKSS